MPRCQQWLHQSECEQDPIAHTVAIAQRVAVADRISTLQIDERQCIIYGFNKHELQRKPERQRRGRRLIKRERERNGLGEHVAQRHSDREHKLYKHGVVVFQRVGIRHGGRDGDSKWVGQRVDVRKR